MSFKDGDVHSQNLDGNFFKKTQDVTAEACGISKRTIQRICLEARKTEEIEEAPGPSFVSPRKSYKRAKYVSEVDDFDGDIVRRTVHEFYDKGEYPTAQLILNSVKKKNDYPGSLRSMQRLLKNLKFSYKKCSDGRKFLMERNDIVSLRCTFLRKMYTLRVNNDTRPIVYLDETWVNQNHSRTIAWQNETNSIGLKIPTGKGGRLIVVHAGCSKYGFIQNSKLVFRSNTGNSTDYHNQMNSDVFKSWFITMLNNLEEPSIIVMDNASYHSTLVDNFPKCNARKSDVQDWLTKKNITFSPLETLAELKQRVKLLIPIEKKYELDELALKMGHEVIRLPPYHCQYNPIELIWAQVKNKVATKNNTFKMVDIEKLTHEALDSITQNDWEKCVKHAESIQDKDYDKEILRDSLLEPIILTILPDDSDWDSSDNDEECIE
ncbi:uncharacterized protein LOC132953799 [Metopolophium dirhodum]|uniref:uncharacterized protein LOC132953799 n=1 Tax=Metopolophium dirhodum TaxID=44670 RepID=UPI0029900C95|nr:uncharacterized protein LOC132953799 [Metopolophium dirhodum]